jgi:hypothetical protein
MQTGGTDNTERLQKMIARLVATNPAGQGLSLIGGFRYRLLDDGVRRSLDVDYHWDGELSEKQTRLAQLFESRLLPEAKRRLGFEGRVTTDANPGTASPFVRVVNLAFWRGDQTGERIQVPVDITRIICLDRPSVRTVDGVVYRTVSDADLIESKVMSVFTRRWLEYRDLVDLFLFASHLVPDYVERVHRKLEMSQTSPVVLAARLSDLLGHRDYHGRAIDELVSTQLEPHASDSIRAAGGGVVVLVAALAILTKLQPGHSRNPGRDK